MIRTLVAEAEFNGSMRDVFFNLAEDPAYFSKHFKGFAPFVPAILKITPEWQGTLKAGGIRKVDLSDGTSVRERVTEHTPPTVHRYEMAEFNFMQKLVCQKMYAEFLLKDLGPKVHVIWTYKIESTNPLQYPLVMIVGWAFHKAMLKCLKSMTG